MALAFLIPGDLSAPTGGYAYDRHVLALLGAHGVEATHVQLSPAFPEPSPADLAATRDLVKGLPEPGPLLVDGLALGAMPGDFVRSLGRLVIALCHHPLCLEAGLSNERKAQLKATETEALGESLAVIVTSPSTRALLVRDFGVPASKITVALPGTDPAPRALGTGDPLHVLAVGSVVPRKGYDILVEALAGLRDRPWRLSIAGAIDRSTSTVASLEAQIRQHHLGDRIVLEGAVSSARLGELYHQADVFVLSSLFEGYGMVLGEAMARGLPIVTTTGGAAAETAPSTAALKVAPGDVLALRQALASLADDTVLRRTMAKASWVAGLALPRWNDTARIIADVVKGISK
ncbi:MAG: glycosyltransferase family 4 protein [Proteobacteria bacterium]|nr:glycosyltransferase family 4 protein [Pseudomonadota bacterium]